MSIAEGSCRSPAPPRLLIVDDEEQNRDVLARRLRRAGYNVEACDDALTLEEDFASGEFDLVILDWMMPRRAGRDALIDLRKRYGAEQFPVIVASALIDDRIVADMLAVGANDYVAKPVSIPVLLARIKAQLDRRTAARALAANLHLAKQAAELSRRGRRVVEAKYSRLMDSARDGIFVLSDDGFVLDANRRAAEIARCDLEALIGMTLDDAFPTSAEPLLERLAATPIVRVESAAAGPTTFLDASATRSEIGGQHFILVIMRDVSEQVRLEGNLRRVQKLDAIGQLTGGVAHDFNNLLTVITISAEALSGAVHDPRLQRLLTTIEQAADRGAQMTRRLLAFARHQPMACVVSDVNEIVGQTVEMLRRMLPESIEITTGLTDAPWQVLVDRAQLEDALLNLALNARDVMPDGGRLTFATVNARLDNGHAEAFGDYAAGEYVCISISDTGCGMEADTLAHVYEPFFTTKEMGKGTGLGLSQVYGFAKQSGGHVRIDSAPGRGTRIDLVFPRTLKSVERACQTDSAKKMQNAVVLLVEDDLLVRDATAMSLEALGCRVIEAEHAAAALDVLRAKGEVDLLLTDLVMPGAMNGRDLVCEARRLRRGLPAIVASGYASEAIDGDAAQVDFVRLAKPFRVEQLGDALSEALSSPTRVGESETVA